MKIKTDHVTNSSSASFIVAVRSDVTRDEIDKIVRPQAEEYVKSLSDGAKKSLAKYHYRGQSNIPDSALENALVSDFILSISNFKIGDFRVWFGECGNDYTGIRDFLYRGFLGDGEKIIFRTDS